MGIFDFLKRKDNKCVEAKKTSVGKFEKLKDVNMKITKLYRDFKKKIEETDGTKFFTYKSYIQYHQYLIIAQK